MIVQARHLEGIKFELASGKNRFIVDEQSAMPSELLLWAVAACFGQAVLHVANRMLNSVEGLSLEVQGDYDSSTFRFSDVTIRVSGRGPIERLEQIVGMAREYCFVTNSLSGSVHIETRACQFTGKD
jgi:uncharacterized OsmC-like protein